jgi:hypothetical protein
MSANPFCSPYSTAQSPKQLKPFCGLRDIAQKYRLSILALAPAVMASRNLAVNEGLKQPSMILL